MTANAPYENAPAAEWRHIRRILPRRTQPLVRALRKRWQRLFLNLEQPYWTVFPYTQVNLFRQRTLMDLAQTLEQKNIQGDIVECGVLDGGTAALLAHATAPSGRTVHLFDAWRGLPQPTQPDGDEAQYWAGEAVGSRRRVEHVMKKLRIDPHRLVYHEGWFADTFPHAPIDRIALLNIDADFHEPVRLCLDTWYPKIVPGGFVHIDDYGAFAGCRKAVDEFLAHHPGVALETRQKDGLHAFYFQKPLHPNSTKGKQTWP